MSKLDKEQVLENFIAAYKEANGSEPQIEAKSGWYSVDGGKNIRLAALEEMTAELKGGAKEEAAPEAAPAKKEEKAVEKPKAKKKAAPKAKKTEKFSVKAFWNEKLDAEKPGSILPR